MKASFKQRFIAYLIDLVIIALLFLVIGFILPKSNNMNVLQQEMNEINEQFLEHQMKFGTYFNRFIEVSYDIDKENVMYGVINAFLILGYFVVLPYFNDGRTIGKMVVSIKVQRKDKELLMLNDLLVRSFFVHGLTYMLVSLAMIYLLNPLFYFITTLIFGLLQIFLVITCVFMIIYRKDKRGLQDIFSKTNVVNSN